MTTTRIGVIDLDAIRAHIRTAGYARGTPEQTAMWREDVAEARANLVIEDMTPTPEEDAMFELMLAEGLSPDSMIDVLNYIYGRPERTT